MATDYQSTEINMVGRMQYFFSFLINFIFNISILWHCRFIVSYEIFGVHLVLEEFEVHLIEGVELPDLVLSQHVEVQVPHLHTMTIFIKSYTLFLTSLLAHFKSYKKNF